VWRNSFSTLTTIPRHSIGSFVARFINWVTQDTHLGLYRNYFGQDIDDTFIADNGVEFAVPVHTGGDQSE